MKKFILMSGVLAALLLCLCGCDGESKKEKESDVLTLVTSANFPPYEFIDGQQIVGIDVDIVKAVARKLNREVKVIDTKFDSVIGN